MPIIPPISKGVKLGLKLNPSAPPQLVGAITTSSQVVMASMALMPMFPSPIPVLPIGGAASAAMTKIEAMMFESYERINKANAAAQSQYDRDYKTASQQRNTAEDQLYEDEIARQEEIREEIVVLEE